MGKRLKLSLRAEIRLCAFSLHVLLRVYNQTFISVPLQRKKIKKIRAQSCDLKYHDLFYRIRFIRMVSYEQRDKSSSDKLLILVGNLTIGIIHLFFYLSRDRYFKRRRYFIRTNTSRDRESPLAKWLGKNPVRWFETERVMPEAQGDKTAHYV